MTYNKTKSIIEDTIKLFNLDLKGLTVLTEAASGHFFVTPIIAAMSGADVIAVSKDSIYGKKDEVQRYVKEKAKLLAVEDKIAFFDASDIAHNKDVQKLIKKADVITNSGFVRPIDRKLLQLTKEGIVIAGMYEDWEIRAEDIDLMYCYSRNIPVAAVKEQSDIIDIFRYVGYLAMKMMFECGLEVYRNKVLIVSSDKFGSTISDILSKNGAETTLVQRLIDKDELPQDNYDALILADCTISDEESESFFNPLLIKEMPSKPILIHLAGKVDYDLLLNNGIECYPHRNGLARKMSETLAYVGIRPVIELQTAGLKAAALVHNEVADGLPYQQIVAKFRNHSLVKIKEYEKDG